MRIRIDRLTKVEGHGRLVVNVKEKEVEEVRLDIFESSRFLESLMVGRSYVEIPEFAARICGLCSISHFLGAAKAIERALGVLPSEQTDLLRKLLHMAAIVQSHVTHIYFLALPDYLGYESAFDMVRDRPKLVRRALKLRKLASDVAECLGGRAIHPISAQIGKFMKLPSDHQLELLLARVKEELRAAADTVELVASLEVPSFERKVEHFALMRPGGYPFYESERVTTTRGLSFPVRDYLKHIKEVVVPHSTAKHSMSSTTGESFLVGALARVNLNSNYLTDEAKEAVAEAGLRVPNYNPCMNNLAQAIEVLHCLGRAICLTEKLLEIGIKKEEIEVKPRAGEGVGAIEAPRGTLYHHYRLDGSGRVEYANIITPTSQNLRNIEEDLRVMVPQLLDLPKDKIVLILEELIRAYDPCISCSTHFLEVKFV